MRVFIEANDLCPDCIRCNYVRMARWSDEEAIIRRVQRKSPYLRGERRARFWRKFFEVVLDPHWWVFTCMVIITLVMMYTLVRSVFQ